MKVIRLKTNPRIYSSNSYLVLGTWNRINDKNSIIDTGIDGFIINDLENINTGLGKKKVDQVILTHSHFDHTGGINPLKKYFNPHIMASINFEGVDRILLEDETILIGDCYFDVMLTPGHSSDSICLYCKSEKIIFTGDINLGVLMSDIYYTDEYIESVKKLSKLKIDVIYPGHGIPITENINEMLLNSLKVMEKSRLRDKNINEYKIII